MKKQHLKVFSLLALLLGIAATALLFFEAFSVGGNKYSGFDLAFGKKLAEGSILGIKGDSKFTFNILLLLALVLPVAGGIFTFVFNNQFGSLIGLLLFAISAILLLTVKETTIISTVELLGNVSKTKTKVEIKLETLGIVSAVLGFVGAGLSGLKLGFDATAK